MSLLQFFLLKDLDSSFNENSLEFIFNNKDSLDWSLISKSCSLNILEKFQECIDWKNASVNKNISLDLIITYQNEVSWYSLSTWIPMNFIESVFNLDKLDFEGLCDNPNLNIQFIDTFKEKLDTTENIINIICKAMLVDIPIQQITEIRPLNKPTIGAPYRGPIRSL